MKRLSFALFFVFLVLTASACGLTTATTTSSSITSTTTALPITSSSSQSPTTAVSTSSGILTTTVTVTTTSTVTSPTTTQTTTSPTTTTEVTTLPITTQTTTLTTITTVSTTSTTTSNTILITTSPEQPLIPTDYDKLQDKLPVIGLPSSGNVQVLVFVVDFSDFPAASSGMSIAQVNTAFNGLPNQTAYESLQSYYWKSSYGQLHITADVFGFYRASNPASYYENEYYKLYATDKWGNYLYDEDEVTYPDSDLIYELLLFYDNLIDYSNYDSNNDGYIDAIYIIYTAPVSFESGSDLWWAYQDIYAYEGDIFDGVEPYYFMWSGVDFFFENTEEIDSRTIIHETGHLLGLEDYYDYDPEGSTNHGGLGGADMMDNTVGDHNPFSKLLLGWVTPQVVNQSMTVQIRPFESSGDMLLIASNWNGTIFTEYLIVSYYTPTGLNQADSQRIFTIPGIIIYHVNASWAGEMDYDSYYPSYYHSNNSDTIEKLLKIIEADMGNEIEDYSLAQDSDLFQVGDVFRQNVYANYQWIHETSGPMNFTISIDALTPTSAIITINFPN